MAVSDEYAAAVDRFKQANWYNGGTTATPTTETQSLAAVANQPGNTSGVKATPYIKADGTTDYHIGGIADNGAGTTMSTLAAQQNNTVRTDTPQLAAASAPVIATQSQSSGLGDAQDYIERLNQLRKDQAYAALEKSKNLALSGLDQEKSGVAPRYYDSRNQAAAGAQQQSRNFAEFMANRGGTASGANAQAQLTNNMSLQGNIGSLNRQENATFDDIARRTSDVNSSYASDLASTDAGLEADKMSALLDNYYKAQQRGDTLAQNQIQNAISQQQLEIQKQTAAVNNQGQSLTNQLTQLRLTDYPTESQNAAKLVQQQLTSGQLGIDAAKYNLDQLKDPNSPTNQAAKLDLQMKQIDASNYSQEAKLKLQQLQKQIADIGVVHKTPQTADEIAMDKQKLLTAQEEYKQLIAKGNTPAPKPEGAYKTDPNFADDISHIKNSPADAAKLDTNPQPFITAYGYDGYLALRKAAGLPDPEAP